MAKKKVTKRKKKVDPGITPRELVILTLFKQIKVLKEAQLKLNVKNWNPKHRFYRYHKDVGKYIVKQMNNLYKEIVAVAEGEPYHPPRKGPVTRKK